MKRFARWLMILGVVLLSACADNPNRPPGPYGLDPCWALWPYAYGWPYDCWYSPAFYSFYDYYDYYYYPYPFGRPPPAAPSPRPPVHLPPVKPPHIPHEPPHPPAPRPHWPREKTP